MATGTPTLGLGVTINTSGLNISGVATAGIVSATTLYGNGENITGIALTIAPLNYNPAVLGSEVAKTSGIGITFNQGVKAGSGNVTLSIANAGVAGTVVENFGIGNSVTITNNSLSIDPTSDLAVEGGQYCITLPSGVITNMAGDNYVGTAYTFETRKYSYQLWGVGTNYVGVLGQNQAEDGIRDCLLSRGLGDVYKRQNISGVATAGIVSATTLYGDGSNTVSYTHLTLPTILLV